MKYCIKCGAKTNDESLYCPLCEAAKGSEEEPNATGLKSEPIDYQGNYRKTNSLFKRYAPMIVVLAVVGFILYKAGAFDKIIANFSGEPDVVVSVTDKKSIPSNWSEGVVGDHIRVDLSVKNKSSKAIRGIEGKILIYDMFGKELIKEQADITGQVIKSGETINYYFTFRANSLIPKEVTAFESDFKDLKISYSVSKIVYK